MIKIKNISNWRNRLYRYTVVELLNNNYNVVIIDNLINSKIDVVNKIKQITNKDVKFV